MYLGDAAIEAAWHRILDRSDAVVRHIDSKPMNGEALAALLRDAVNVAIEHQGETEAVRYNPSRQYRYL